MFPFTLVPAYGLPVYASQCPLPDTTQDSVRGCWLGFAAVTISDDWLPYACKAQPSPIFASLAIASTASSTHPVADPAEQGTHAQLMDLKRTWNCLARRNQRLSNSLGVRTGVTTRNLPITQGERQ